MVISGFLLWASCLKRLSFSNCHAHHRGCISWRICTLGSPCCDAPSYRPALFEEQKCDICSVDWFLRFRRSFSVITIRPLTNQYRCPFILRSHICILSCWSLKHGECFFRLGSTITQLYHRSLINATYFMQTQTIALTLFGILAGISMNLMHRFKVYQLPVVSCIVLTFHTFLACLGVWSRCTRRVCSPCRLSIA